MRKYFVTTTFEIDADNQEDAWKIINDISNHAASGAQTLSYKNFIQVYHVDEPREEQ